MSKQTELYDGPVSLSQIDLIAGIGKLVEKLSGKKLAGTARHFNTIIAAADLIVADFARGHTPATSGMGLAEWLKSDDTGLSSRFMASVLAGAPQDRHFDDCDHPWDSDDFGRCVRFLEAVPEARENLSRLKAYSPVWSGLVDRWAELENDYRSKRHRAVYDKIHEIMAAVTLATAR